MPARHLHRELFDRIAARIPALGLDRRVHRSRWTHGLALELAEDLLDLRLVLVARRLEKCDDDAQPLGKLAEIHT
jgi:hypothetical protein